MFDEKLSLPENSASSEVSTSMMIAKVSRLLRYGGHAGWRQQRLVALVDLAGARQGGALPDQALRDRLVTGLERYQALRERAVDLDEEPQETKQVQKRHKSKVGSRVKRE